MKQFKRPLLVVFSMMLFFLMSISADAAFTVTKKNMGYPPASFSAGTNVVLKGTLSSKTVIKKVTTAIYDSTGKKILQKYAAKVNALKYNMANSNSGMRFEDLPAGSYYFKIVATSVNNEKKAIAKKAFTVKPVKMQIEADIPGPTTLKEGTSFTVRGTITTNLPMKSVVVSIYTDNEKLVQRASKDVYGRFYNLNASDRDIDFSTLKAGSYFYRVSLYDMQGKKKRLMNHPFTVKQATVPSSIKISNPLPAKDITNFPQGKGYALRGLITSSNKLAEVKAELIGPNNKVVCSKTVNPGTTTYSLQNSAIDAAMTFERLPVGITTFVVSAKDIAGKKAVLINRKFFVMAKESKFWFDDRYTVVPSSDFSIRKGTAYGLSGMIRSNLPIMRILATITDTKGNTYYTKTIKPTRTTTYTLGGSDIDNAMHFEKLPVGTYLFLIEVEDTKSSVAHMISRTFTVK